MWGMLVWFGGACGVGHGSLGVVGGCVCSAWGIVALCAV